MEVTLLAHTTLTRAAYELLDPCAFDSKGYPIAADNADHLAEIAGRECYQSWNRPNPATADNATYLANIIRQGHTSVLEHASATFRLTGVSRSLTHELIRHRHLSFSQQSQRYVDESESSFVLPPWKEATDHRTRTTMDRVRNLFNDHHRVSRELYTELVTTFTDGGMTRKSARQAARAVLPNGTETRMVVTGNLRAWRWVIHMRNSVYADTEIQHMAAEILRQLREIAPNSFQDLADEPRN